MRLLLFFISCLFSAIFYFFYNLKLGKSIFWMYFTRFKIESLSPNLLYESAFFLVLWIIFFIYFSPKVKIDPIFQKIKQNVKIFYIWFYIIFFWLLISGKIFYDTFILFGIIFFLFSDLSFNFISNAKYFRVQKENIRYFWLFLNFCSSFISLYYIFNFWFSTLLFLVLLFNITFNYLLYKKYWNYASAFCFYVIFICLLLFFILRLYYFLILFFK